MTRKAAFTQDDLTRALKSCARADLPVARIDLVPGGKIVIFAAREGESLAAASGVNEWDEVLTKVG